MIVHRSNRTEELVEELARVTSRGMPGPFARETIVVQGRGMERWISMQLADRLGIWAHPDFTFPRTLLERVFEAFLGGRSEGPDPYARECLMWSVAELLPGLASGAGFAPVARYLADDVDGRKLMQLAERVATGFDDYVTYRPEMILAWENDRRVSDHDDEEWQARLWREIVGRHGSGHLARRAALCLEALERGAEPAGLLPHRVSVFGVSTLPPLFLELLARISERIELHLFVLNPSREFWAEIATTSEQRRARRQAPGEDEASLHLDVGHPLLASLGRLGRDFQAGLEEAGYQDDGEDLHREPGGQGAPLLHLLQGDMLRLEARGRADAPPLPFDAADASLRVHSCHSPMREVEVLKDALLACFEECPGLEPKDVVVMTPDIETYAPFIEAVFGTDGHATKGGRERGDERTAIPHRIADRGSSSTHEVVEALGRALDLLTGRFSAAEGVDLLGIDCIRGRFDIALDDVERLREWVVSSGIRWGVDAADRKAAGQPESAQNTWRFGLERLLLGVAVAEDEHELFEGVRPLRSVDGEEAALLGRFVELCELLFGWRDRLRDPRSPRRWQEDWGRLLDELIEQGDETASQHLLVRRTLEDIVAFAECAGFAGEVSLETMRAELERGLQRSRRPHHFLSGGVTFCALVPMRSIPFRVVALLGMNDDAFPHMDRPVGFDLIAANPRAGDRSPREDDRYLFLEALLSARDRLVITYVGQSIRTGDDLPPSVVVSELLDAVDEATFVEPACAGVADTAEAAEAKPRDLIVVRHPLKPFSPGYFDAGSDPRLFSFSELQREAAERLVSERSEPAPFAGAPLARPDEDAEGGGTRGEVDLDALARFFEKPAQAFLERRLGLRMPQESDALKGREPFALDTLERWRLGDELVELGVRQGELAGARALLQGTGLLPSGIEGRLRFEELSDEVALLVGRVNEVSSGEPLAAIPVDLAIGDVRITGSLASVWPGGQLRYGYSRVGKGSELAFWVRHLVLNCLVQQGSPAHDVKPLSHFVGRPASGSGCKRVEFGAVEDASTLVAELLELYAIGLDQPLPLLPVASRAYAKAREKDEPEKALAKAKGGFGNAAPGQRSESEDLAVSQAFQGQSPFDVTCSAAGELDFGAIAERVFGPLLQHREEPS